MKTIFLFLPFVVLAGCKPAAVVDPLTKAESLIQESITNDVVGYTRTISINVDLREKRAKAIVEFINPVGGVDRTNLPYILIPVTNGSFVVSIDMVRIIDAEDRAFKERLEKIKRGE